MNPKQLREHIIRPVLKKLDKVGIPYSQEAEDLLLLTACAESHCGYYIKQINGPAIGVFQMEPTTEQDIWNNYLIFQVEEPLWDTMKTLKKGHGLGASALFDPFYAVGMARLHYYRDPQPLPTKEGDTEESIETYLTQLAGYWKRVYNTELGKGTVDKAVSLAEFYGDFFPSVTSQP